MSEKHTDEYVAQLEQQVREFTAQVVSGDMEKVRVWADVVKRMEAAAAPEAGELVPVGEGELSSSEERRNRRKYGAACPSCGYTQADVDMHRDHHLCREPWPPKGNAALAPEAGEVTP